MFDGNVRGKNTIIETLDAAEKASTEKDSFRAVFFLPLTDSKLKGRLTHPRARLLVKFPDNSVPFIPDGYWHGGKKARGCYQQKHTRMVLIMYKSENNGVSLYYSTPLAGVRGGPGRNANHPGPPGGNAESRNQRSLSTGSIGSNGDQRRLDFGSPPPRGSSGLDAMFRRARLDRARRLAARSPPGETSSEETSCEDGLGFHTTCSPLAHSDRLFASSRASTSGKHITQACGHTRLPPRPLRIRAVRLPTLGTSPSTTATVTPSHRS